MKSLIWHDSAIKVVRSFPVSMKKEIGSLLLILQRGEKLGMPSSKPIKIGLGSLHELRIKDKAGIFRVSIF